VIFDTDRLEHDAAYREDMRHRFITDHFFAAEVIGFRDFSVRAHTPAVKLYGPKNPKVSIREQPRKRRIIHLDPRHTFKTSLKRVDRVMWIAAFPEDFTALCSSETQLLSEKVVTATARAFYRGPGDPAALLHLLYPELVVRKYPEGEWNTPVRRRTGAGDLDATLAYTSPQSTATGLHPWMKDYDDVEGPKNSGISATAEVRQAVIDTCDQNENLVRDGGFISIGGTRYHPLDYYGKCLERAARSPESWDWLVRPSLIVKSGAKLTPGEFPAEEDVELLFGEFENLGYRELREKFYANFESFQCQQQNDPQGGSVPTFDEKMYLSCLVEASRVPYGGHDAKVYVCWRPRYGGKSGMEKYLEGAAAKIVDGKVYVIGAWQTTRTPSGEAELIVQVQKELQADGVMLLDVPGSNHMSVQIRNEAARRNVSLRLQWLYWNEDDATRASEIKALEPMMKVGRVMFSTGMSKAGECQKQFVHYGLVEETGIIECVSKFADMVPLSQMRANMEEEELEWRRRQRDNAQMAQVMMQSGMSVVDEQLRRKTEAHMAAMQQVVTHMPGGPPLPGGLDG
jgi:hypothetical protein